MLAFVVGPAWNYAEGESLIAGTPIWGYRFSENAKTEHKWKPNEVAGDPDGPGTDFMMYIATKVMVHPAGSSTGPSSSTVSSMLAFLNNQEGSSEQFAFEDWYKTNSAGKRTSRGQSEMQSKIESSLQHGVPAIVGVQMNLLPSQANFRDDTTSHWVTVVAYDPNYYYYVDTCWTVELCGGAGKAAYDPYDKSGTHPNQGEDPALAPLGKKNADGNKWGTVFSAAAGDDPKSLSYRAQYPGTWRIKKSDLWRAVSATHGVGWFKYSGSKAFDGSSY
jgi:hypothetical protein